MENDTPERKLLASCKTFLSRWHGSDVHLRELTTSHQSLTIVLTRADQAGNLVLYCEPARIHAPLRWTNSAIEISSSPEGDEDSRWSIRDTRADVEILCGWIEVKEHVKLY